MNYEITKEGENAGFYTFAYALDGADAGVFHYDKALAVLKSETPQEFARQEAHKSIKNRIYNITDHGKDTEFQLEFPL